MFSSRTFRTFARQSNNIRTNAPKRANLSSFFNNSKPSRSSSIPKPTTKPAASPPPMSIPSASASSVRLASTTSTGKPSISVVEPGECNDEDAERIWKHAHYKGRTIFVDFYADWCGPCVQLGPVLVDAIKQNGKSILMKVDIEVAVKSAAKYGITSLPTVMALVDGEVVDSFIGLKSPGAVQEFVKANSK